MRIPADVAALQIDQRELGLGDPVAGLGSFLEQFDRARRVARAARRR